ncbi:hypothetical protein ECSTECC16502_3462 [Escherichia coli STEC_C165-02]|nr:hypothetical protein ECSTECC16502_3462 [Escherichia coli STEC_C165-02]
MGRTLGHAVVLIRSASGKCRFSGVNAVLAVLNRIFSGKCQ